MTVEKPKGSRPRQIMIVDDERSVMRSYEKILSRHFPYDRIEVVANGFDAIELFRKHRHDVLIMDLNMPVMNGIKAEYEIRMYCGEQSIPEPNIIFCTGDLPSDEVQELVDTNPSCSIILKPVDPEALVDAIAKCFGA